MAGVCLSIFLFKKYSEEKAKISFEGQLKKWGIFSRNIQLNGKQEDYNPYDDEESAGKLA